MTKLRNSREARCEGWSGDSGMEAACCSLENKTTPAKVPAVAGLGPAGAVNDLAARRCTVQLATLQPHQHGHSAPPSTGVGARFGQKCGAEQSPP